MLNVIIRQGNHIKRTRYYLITRSLELVMLRFLSVALKLLFVVLLVVVLQLLQQLQDIAFASLALLLTLLRTRSLLAGYRFGNQFGIVPFCHE